MQRICGQMTTCMLQIHSREKLRVSIIIKQVTALIILHINSINNDKYWLNEQILKHKYSLKGNVITQAKVLRQVISIYYLQE